jgi:LmbE family N-acetylglucosaminyl deacetylase
MRVLSIAVHPDDETLGCGGTLLKHAAAGDEIHWLIVTAAAAPQWSAEVIDRQRQQIEAVEGAYPFRSLSWLKLPTTQLDHLPLGDLVAAIRERVAAVRPEVVYIPNRSDAHSDHRVVFSASMAVLKSFYLPSLGVRKVLACEAPSETDAAPALAENAFVPNVFVGVSATFARKQEIFALFASEVHEGFGPRGISAVEALARHRGAAVGVQYAEAFMLMLERA